MKELDRRSDVSDTVRKSVNATKERLKDLIKSGMRRSLLDLDHKTLEDVIQKLDYVLSDVFKPF